MKPILIEFEDLERRIKATGKSFKDILATEIGKAYVIAITRDGCPACERQKPKLDKLAESFPVEKNDKAVFIRIHVKYSEDFREESLRSKDVLSHYFFPTNIILVRTRDRGVIELFRSVSPRMSELKRNIAMATEIANMLGKA
jgi:thiol-disulfide isomerase/thioredoxin